MSDAATSPGWNGWGNGAANTRFAANAGLTAADLPRLKLKWAFGYAGVNAARAQPTIAGGRLFVASENGEAHALDPKTGCTHWTFRAQAGIRTGLVVGPYKNGVRIRPGGVLRRRAGPTPTRWTRNTGRQLWVRKVDDHPAASLTGAPTVAGGRVFVPVQGLNEEGQGGTGKYPCCTFRGSLVALDANTGAVLWKTLHGGRAAAAREEQGRHSDVRAGRRRHLVVADRRYQARHGLRGHRQRLRRSAAEDDQRRGRDGHADRRGEVGAPDHAQRQLDARLRTEESGQSGLPRDARARSRLLGVAVACHGERPRPAGAAAEVGHGLGASIPTRTARWCGSGASVRAAALAASGAARWTGSRPTSACRTCCRRIRAACGP